jgi:hypothetical protein
MRTWKPEKGQKKWIEIHQEDLMANWKLAVEGQQPHKIEPLR